MVTGAAVIITTPVWLPCIGGSLLVAGATLASWTAAGSAVGALTGGTWAYLRNQQRNRHISAGPSARRKELPIKNNDSLLQVLTREGVLITASVRYWRAHKKLKAEDIGLPARRRL